MMRYLYHIVIILTLVYLVVYSINGVLLKNNIII